MHHLEITMMRVCVVGLGGVPWLMVLLMAKSITMCLATHVESCNCRVLLVDLRRSLGQHVATRCVRSLILRTMLENEGGALRGNAIELLLFGDEMHLGLRLHLVVQLARS